MPNDHPAASNAQTAIRTPDQLQQAKLPDAPAPVETADQQREASNEDTGILRQLGTERAHD